MPATKITEEIRLNPMPLSPRQEQIIIGTLLGDGNLFSHPRAKDWRFRTVSRFQDREYLRWKWRELRSTGLFPNSPPIRVQKKGPCWRLYSLQHSIFTEYRKLFYPGGKKVISPKVLELLDDLGLAVWYQDDGSFPSKDGKKGGRLSLSTESFLLKEVELVRDWIFNKYGISFHISCAPSRGSKPVMWLYNRGDVSRFLDIVGPYIVPCMSRKSWDDKGTKEEL